MKTKKVSYEVRLWGIDCPEYTQPFASEARAISRHYLEGKTIKVQVKYQDRYDRFIGLATYGNVNINQRLVEDGAAWVYKRYCRAAICRKWTSLEKRARESGTGLWHSRDPIPPWEWRKEKK
ncbi:thermonuclease family protein [Desulfopila sp. IMCC35008]|uniref:thermonuclease family protein n=1 Tax=Desulfopila sp. IMCC35008 TaxID=2653858 RepID=UPI0013D7566E|nr:thermonuclease family protein [Desulfopila sp. IMCC35008]